MNFLFLLFQDAGGGGSIFASPIFLFLALGLILYFIIIRPQQKQRKDLDALIAELKINDEIVTNGGIIGKIKEVRDTSYIIQSADKSFLEIARTAVIGKRAEPTAK